jgi:hypothetical protein
MRGLLMRILSAFEPDIRSGRHISCRPDDRQEILLITEKIFTRGNAPEYEVRITAGENSRKNP